MDKERFVDGILEAMASDLTPEVLQKLEAVLVTRLRDIRLEAESRELVVADRHWERVLRTWLATKRLENCSPGTLSNYGRAMRFFMGVMLWDSIRCGMPGLGMTKNGQAAYWDFAAFKRLCGGG